ncbi:bifunctional methylenetetrahydrofolate dehydrogenase/methenyltetrahydrofolate cyclohydrolase FolD [Candidatus Woesearchaeota archaeon]|nr:bifunctional methylenetetrahydrofolate dehydrogenase/methenyltetrahydrofolate cyclohydrolase FolD [Candidatus Woesearchaeota archaeon]
MAAKIIDGKAIADKIIEGLKEKIDGLDKKPGLAVVLVGDNPASSVYVNIKSIACEKAGIRDMKQHLPENTSEEEVLGLIEELNNDSDVDGILVQLPLPKHIDEHKIIEAINPLKDVDGFHFTSIGNLFINREKFVPCTPKGIIRLLEEEGIEIEGKHAVVVGRSNIVGKPVAMLLMNRNATVTVCHSKTKDLGEETRKADILIAAVGKPKLITADMVKQGAVVVDVGINKVDDRLIGDVDFDDVKEKAGYITPVPKGVGPMTVAMLLENTFEAYNK